MPFPWSRSWSRDRHGEHQDEEPHNVKTDFPEVAVVRATPLDPLGSIVKQHAHSNVQCGSPECCDDISFLEYRLPPKGATAGKVLNYAKSVITSLFAKHEPMIWKVGYTHDCSWRWNNCLYGYRFDRDRWSKMVVLYQSEEPFGPAMLEASLIDIFKSILSMLI